MLLRYLYQKNCLKWEIVKILCLLFFGCGMSYWNDQFVRLFYNILNFFKENYLNKKIKKRRSLMNNLNLNLCPSYFLTS